jgi:hypothetical protein
MDYTKLGDTTVKMYHANNGVWCITGAAATLSKRESGGEIRSTSASCTPHGLQWEFLASGVWRLDPLLTVTGVGATEFAAARAAELAAAEAETQRSLAIQTVHFTGNLFDDFMGFYSRDATHSPKRGKNVYRLQGCLFSDVFLYQATDGLWCITYGTAQMVSGGSSATLAPITASTTASPSPVGLKWGVSNGTLFVLNPRLTMQSAPDY